MSHHGANWLNMTKIQKKQEGDVFKAMCPSRPVISRLCGKWSILILVLLKGSPKRFNEIKKEIQGISQKVLTENLRSLERDGLINRKVYTQSALKVEYKTTTEAKELLKIVKQFTNWSEQNWKKLQKNNEIHDSRI